MMHLRQRLILRSILGLLSLCCFLPQLFAQSPEEGMISPLVGPTIDQTEYMRFDLQTILARDAAEIDSLRIIPRGEESYLLFYYLKDGSSLPQEIDKVFLRSLKTHLENQGRRLLIQWQVYRDELENGRAIEIFVETYGGIVYRGSISAMNPYEITLTRASGDISLTMEDIRRMGPSDGPTYQGDDLSEDIPPGYMRYFFSPNAIPTRKGDAYLGVTRLAYHRGLTNQVGVTVAPGLISLLYSALIQDFYFLNATGTIKYGKQVLPNLHLAGNLSIQGGGANLLGQARFGYIGGWGTALATYGNYDHNITVGAGFIGFKGYGDLESPVLIIPEPTITVGGTVRVGDVLSLTTENWTWGSSNTFGGNFQNGFRFYFISLGAKVFLPLFNINAGLINVVSSTRTAGNPNQFTLVTPIPLPFVGVYLNL